MAWLIYDEMNLFAVCLVLGIILAFVYDLLRIFRMLIHHNDLFIDIEDLGFWLLTAWFVFQTLFQYNQGELRGYAFLGMFFGVILYTLTLSRLILFVVKKLLPFWEKGKKIVKKPFYKLLEVVRKSLKNIVLEVKMAIRSR